MNSGYNRLLTLGINTVYYSVPCLDETEGIWQQPARKARLSWSTYISQPVNWYLWTGTAALRIYNNNCSRYEVPCLDYCDQKYI